MFGRGGTVFTGFLVLEFLLFNIFLQIFYKIKSKINVNWCTVRSDSATISRFNPSYLEPLFNPIILESYLFHLP